jgi:hypothetical protein
LQRIRQRIAARILRISQPSGIGHGLFCYFAIRLGTPVNQHFYQKTKTPPRSKDRDGVVL